MGQKRKDQPGYELAENTRGKFWKKVPVAKSVTGNDIDTSLETVKKDFMVSPHDFREEESVSFTPTEPTIHKGEIYQPTRKEKFILTRGFPGSGKTTWATSWKDKDPENRINVNRDDIRAMIGAPGVGSKDQEETVTNIHNSILEQGLKDGKNIIISDTHLRAKHMKRLLNYAFDHGYDVEIHDFDVDLDELIKRDENREKSVGEDVLRDMWSRFSPKQKTQGKDVIDNAYKSYTQKKQEIEHYSRPYKNDPSNPRAILVDVDGTLANHEGVRNVYDYSKVYDDLPHEDIIRSVQLEAAAGTKVIIMSGREDSCKDDTIRWLEKYDVPFDDVFMRKTGDMRPDWMIKDDLIRENVQDNYYIEYGFDDREQVVEHNRKNGYRIYAVDFGDF